MATQEHSTVEVHHHCKVCGTGIGYRKQYCSDCLPKYKDPNIRNCRICGKEFNPQQTVLNGKKSYIACSVDCKRELLRLRMIKKGKMTGTGKRKPAKSFGVFGETKLCPICGLSFINSNGTKEYCSRECRDKNTRTKEHGKMRRAKFYGKKRGFENLSRHVAVDMLQIYERDKWKCILCGKSVDKSLKYPDRMSASIDHIIPLSHEGLHVPENIQLAHLGCNMMKGNRGIGKPEQLWLIG